MAKKTRAKRSSKEDQDVKAEPKQEAKPKPPVVVGYQASKVQRQLGLDVGAMNKVLKIQKANSLPTVMDAVRHIIEAT